MLQGFPLEGGSFHASLRPLAQDHSMQSIPLQAPAALPSYPILCKLDYIKQTPLMP